METIRFSLYVALIFFFFLIALLKRQVWEIWALSTTENKNNMKKRLY